MANPNPYQARQAKSQKRVKAGDLRALRQRLWRVIDEATVIVENREESTERRLKAGHALTQASGSYLKVLEAIELTTRLKEIEKKVDDDGLVQ